MESQHQSDIFNRNFFFWNIFAIWQGRKDNRYYKYFSVFYLTITLLIYNILLTLNLIYTPRKIEMLIREVIFLFTEIAVVAKVVMVLKMRPEILEALTLMDSKIFNAVDNTGNIIITKHNKVYKTYWMLNAVGSNITYWSQVLLPILICLLLRNEIELPICKYYFLADEVRDRFFIIIYLYQSIGMFGHMMYNVNVDTFIAGLIFIGISQFKVLNHKLARINKESLGDHKNLEQKKVIHMTYLNSCLMHYEILLRYCSTIQEILNVTMFVQFGVASAIICGVLCGLLMATSTETQFFLVLYLFAMILQIFVPAWLGTQLSYQSRELMNAAYSCNWIPLDARFKRSLRLLMLRADVPVVITGLKMFPLSLVSFTSIMKTGYSFFTLVRNFQDKEN